MVVVVVVEERGNLNTLYLSHQDRKVDVATHPQ